MTTETLVTRRRDLITRQLPGAEDAANRHSTRLLVEATIAFIDKRKRERAERGLA